MMKLTLLLVFFSTFALAIPEANFPELWKKKVLPFYEALPKGELTNAQGLTLKFSYIQRPENKRTLIIAPGRTEPAVKYAELVYDLRETGFNIFVIDHQGQGESSRLQRDTNRGDVVRFQDYVTDFEQFITKIKELSPGPLSLIAHSMGGAIATHYMAQHPETFTKAVLFAPMFEMITSPYSERTARLYTTFLMFTGKGRSYAPGQGPYKPENDTFEANTVTHSEVRFGASKFLFVSRPELALGGPTVRWVHTSLKATRRIDKLSVHTPVLLFQAEEDLVVRPARQTSFCQRSQCELILMKGSRHEILMEKDAIRDRALEKVRSFLEL